MSHIMDFSVEIYIEFGKKYHVNVLRKKKIEVERMQAFVWDPDRCQIVVTQFQVFKYL